MKKQDRIDAINAITIAYGDRLNTLSAKDLAALHKMLKARAKLLAQETSDPAPITEDPAPATEEPTPVATKSKKRKVVLTEDVRISLEKFALSLGLTVVYLKKGDGITLKAKGQGNVAKLYWSVGGFDFYLKNDVDDLFVTTLKEMAISHIRHENSKYNKDMNWYTLSPADTVRVLTALSPDATTAVLPDYC